MDCDYLKLPKELQRVLELAARWHDIGKSHPAFQGAIIDVDSGPRPQRPDLAKGPRKAWLRPQETYRITPPDGPPLPELPLTPAPAALGISTQTGASWRERSQSVLKKYGPGRLAYFESILRAADVEASRLKTEDPSLLNKVTVGLCISIILRLFSVAPGLLSKIAGCPAHCG